MMEIVNYATWDNPFTMFEIMGFGKARPERVAAALPRFHRAGVGCRCCTWWPMASASPRRRDRAPRGDLRADTDIEIASGTVAEGTISGMRFEIVGVVDGEERIVVEHVTRLRDEDAPSGRRARATGSWSSGEPT
jgi:hypothetical protein